jgi:hypothetical protein
MPPGFLSYRRSFRAAIGAAAMRHYVTAGAKCKPVQTVESKGQRAEAMAQLAYHPLGSARSFLPEVARHFRADKGPA